MNIRASGISFMFFLFSDHPPYGSIDWTGSNWPPNGDIVMLFLDTRYVICSTPCMDYPWLWNNSFQLCICFFLDRSQAGYSADPSYETILSNCSYWAKHSAQRILCLCLFLTNWGLSGLTVWTWHIYNPSFAINSSVSTERIHLLIQREPMFLYLAAN